MTVQYMQGFETLGGPDDMTIQGITASVNSYINPCVGAYAGSNGLVFGYSGSTITFVQRVYNNNGFWVTAKIRKPSIQAYPFAGSNYASFQIRQYGISLANGNWMSVSIVPNGTNANYLTYGTNFDFQGCNTSQLLPSLSTDSNFQGFLYDPSRSQYLVFYYASSNGHISGFTSLSTPSTTFNDLYSSGSKISSMVYEPTNKEVFAITIGNSSILKRAASAVATTNFTSVQATTVNLHEVCITTNKIIAVGSGNSQYTALKTSSSTFTQTTPFTSEVWSIAFDGTNVVASGSSGELYTSTDEGTTWSKINLGSGIMVVRYANNVWMVSNPSNNLMYRCTGNPTLVANWNKQLFTIGTIPSAFTGNSNFMLRSNEGYFIAVNASGCVASSDGLRWVGSSTDSNTPGSSSFGVYNYPIRGSSGISTILSFATAYGGTQGAKTLTLTPNINGSNGTAVTVPADVWTTIGIDVQLTGFGMFTASMYVNDSLAYSSSFNAQIGSPPVWTIVAASGDLSTSIAYSSSNNVGISTSSGATYNEIQFPDGNFATNSYQCAAVSRDGMTIVAVPYGNVNYFWISRDQGVTWTKTSILPSSQTTYVVTISGDGSTIYAAYSAQNGSLMYSSSNQGNSWISLAVVVSSGSISAVPSLATNYSGNTVIYSSFMGYCISTNKGSSWSYTTTNGSGRNPSLLPVVSDDGTKIYLSNGNTNMVYSTNSGTTFSTLAVSPGMETFNGSSDGTIVYYTSGGTVYKYVNQVLANTYTPGYPSGMYWALCSADGSTLMSSQNNGSMIHTFNGTTLLKYNPAINLENVYFGAQDTFNSINCWDDLVITDYIGTNIGNLGPIKVLSQTLDGAGSTTNWIPTPSTETNVQAATLVPYSASQNVYVGATNVGDTDIYTSSTLNIPAGYRPLAVSTEAVVQKTFPNTPQFQMGLSNTSTQSLNPVVALSNTTPYFVKYVSNADPSGNPWTAPNVKASNVVIKKVG